MFENYVPLYAANGQRMPESGRTDGAKDYEMNFGGFGYGGDPNNYNGSNGENDKFLQSIGWTGGDPFMQPTGMASEGGQEQVSGYKPEFTQFLRDNNITLAATGKDRNHVEVRAFQNGQPIGSPFLGKTDPDNAFGVAMLAAAAYVGVAAAGAGAASGGLSGMDLAADAAVGAGNNIGTAAGSFGGGSGGLAGTGLPAYSVNPGAGTQVAGPGGLSGGAEAAGGGALYETPVLTGEFGELGTGAAGGGGWGTGAAGAAPSASSGSWLDSIGSFAKNNPGIVNAAGGLINTGIGAWSANNATNAAKDASAAADARLAPWYASGAKALARNDALSANPASIKDDPAYQFRFNEGMRASTNLGASRGMAYSGAQDKALTRWAQGNASGELDKVFDRNLRTAGLGGAAASQSANNSLDLGRTVGGSNLYLGNLAQDQVNNSLGTFNYSQYRKPGYP